MSATIDITCEYCAVQRHESNVWRKIENYDDMTRREVWCCDECWVSGDEYAKEACEEMGEEFTGQGIKVLEIINDDEDDDEDDDKFTCDKCNCVKDREHYVSVDGDVSGDTICDECVDEDDLVVDTENAHAQILKNIATTPAYGKFEEGEYGVLFFHSEETGWLYAEPYCFNCGRKACADECICEEDEMDWREAEYEAE